MGQSSSRVRHGRTLSSSSTTQIRNPALDDDNARPTGEPNPTAQTLGPAATSKRARPSLRRSVMGLVSRSSSNSLAPPKDSQTRQTDKTLSLRKRWRSSKRFSKATSAPNLAQHQDSQLDPSATDIVLDHSNSDLTSPSDPGPSSLATSIRASRPSTPFPISRPPTPRIDLPPDDEPLSEEERRLSQNIGTWLSGAGPSSPPPVQQEIPSSVSSPTSLPGPIEREPSEYLSALSHSPTDDSPPISPIDTSASNQSAPSPPPTEQTPQSIVPPRHFPPPGTLVVVQGVVNTTDAPSAPSSSRPHHSSAPRPPTDPSLLAPPPTRHRRSASAPRSMNRSSIPAEERPSPRAGLSSLLQRPNSMISRRPSTESGSSITQASTSHDFSSDASPSGSSSPTTPEASTTHINDQRDASANDPADPHRPLSPGSIDVLGTLLR